MSEKVTRGPYLVVPNDPDAYDRRQEQIGVAVSMRARGRTMTQIAKALGLARARDACNLVASGLRRISVDPEQWRRIQLHEIELQRASLYDMQVETIRDVQVQTEVMLSLQERTGRLVAGLDVPERTEVAFEVESASSEALDARKQALLARVAETYALSVASASVDDGDE